MAKRRNTAAPQYAEVLAAAITGTTAGTAITLLALTREVRQVTLRNTTNLVVGVSRNGVQFDELPATSGFVQLDLAANENAWKSGDVIGVFAASAPASGKVLIGVPA